MEENRRVIGPYCTVVQTLYEYTDEALSGNRLLLQPQRSPDAPAERTVARRYAFVGSTLPKAFTRSTVRGENVRQHRRAILYRHSTITSGQ